MSIKDKITGLIVHWRDHFENIDEFVHTNAWSVLAWTIVLLLFSCWFYINEKLRGPWYLRLFYAFCSLVKSCPIYVRGKIASEMAEAQDKITEMVHKKDTNADWNTSLPEQGLSRLEILRTFERYRTRENGGLNKREKPNYLKGAMSGACFNLERNAEEKELMKQIFGESMYSNPLWPAAFPEVRRMEQEVVTMVLELLNGPHGSCGTMTAGGSMSILQAVHAYRSRGFKKGINFPEMILPSSAHAAFYKAAGLFGIKVVEIEVAHTGFVVDPKRVAAAINSNTILIVGSVPNYPYGTCDPIEELSEIALRKQVGLHVDGCCGGFLVPFFNQNDAPAFDFRLQGVTSISSDTHKYAMSPKGSSVIVYRNEQLRADGFYSHPDWTGGIYASPTLEGSRNGSAIAVTWASLMFHGKAALRESAHTVRRVTRELRERIAKLDGMTMMGHGDVCIVAWRNSKVDDYKITDIMEKYGYYLSPLQFPVGAHLMVTPLHGAPGWTDGFVECMEAAITELLSAPNQNTGGAAAMYGLTVKIPDRSIVSEIATIYQNAIYSRPPEKSKATDFDPIEYISDERALEVFGDLHEHAAGLALLAPHLEERNGQAPALPVKKPISEEHAEKKDEVVVAVRTFDSSQEKEPLLKVD